jgi:hypothetical protein
VLDGDVVVEAVALTDSLGEVVHVTDMEAVREGVLEELGDGVEVPLTDGDGVCVADDDGLSVAESVGLRVRLAEADLDRSGVPERLPEGDHDDVCDTGSVRDGEGELDGVTDSLAVADRNAVLLIEVVGDRDADPVLDTVELPVWLDEEVVD